MHASLLLAVVAASCAATASAGSYGAKLDTGVTAYTRCEPGCGRCVIQTHGFTAAAADGTGGQAYCAAGDADAASKTNPNRTVAATIRCYAEAHVCVGVTTYGDAACSVAGGEGYETFACGVCQSLGAAESLRVQCTEGEAAAVFELFPEPGCVGTATENRVATQCGPRLLGTMRVTTAAFACNVFSESMHDGESCGSAVSGTFFAAQNTCQQRFRSGAHGFFRPGDLSVVSCPGNEALPGDGKGKLTWKYPFGYQPYEVIVAAGVVFIVVSLCIVAVCVACRRSRRRAAAKQRWRFALEAAGDLDELPGVASPGAAAHQAAGQVGPQPTAPAHGHNS